MSRLLIALIAGAFTGAALAQASAPAADTKAKQEMVDKATAGATKTHGVQAAEGSAKAAATKNAPKAVPDKAAGRAAVTSATEGSAKGAGVKAAEGSATAAADTTPKKPKPKMGDHEKELKKAATP